jgi:hypothetical protein
MEIKFEKQFTNDNKISACYVVDQMREILNIKELEKLQLAIHEFKNDLIHDMGVNKNIVKKPKQVQMCQQLTKEEKENANRTRSQQ